MKNKTPYLELLAFVLEKAAAEPMLKRAELYRGLAVICGDKSEQKKLLAMADALTNADSLCREFNFSIIQLNTDNTSK